MFLTSLLEPHLGADPSRTKTSSPEASAPTWTRPVNRYSVWVQHKLFCLPKFFKPALIWVMAQCRSGNKTLAPSVTRSPAQNLGWGQFNSGIGIAGQFQFRNWNWNWNWWNWNWWNWKWNWNWKPWNWNWNWKPELIFFATAMAVNYFQILALTNEVMIFYVTDSSCNK